MKTSAVRAALLAAGAIGAISIALADAIDACVDAQNGLVRIVAPGTDCGPNHYPLRWGQQGEPGPAGAVGPQGVQGPQGPSGSGGSPINVMYITGGVVPGTAVARAMCPTGWRVAGGGGITSGAGAGLQQSFPISDNTGLIAFGSAAIGWQAAAEDWGFVQAFVVCVSQ